MPGSGKWVRTSASKKVFGGRLPRPRVGKIVPVYKEITQRFTVRHTGRVVLFLADCLFLRGRSYRTFCCFRQGRIGVVQGENPHIGRLGGIEIYL